MNTSDITNKARKLKIKSNGDFYGVIGEKNTTVVPFIYDEILRTFSSGLINVCKNGKWGCLDLEGNIVIPIEYDWITPFGKEEQCISNAKRNGKWGILNRNGKEVIPCVYDDEVLFKNDIAIVSSNGQKGVIDRAGKCIIPCCYSFLRPFVNSSRLFKVVQNNKCGIIDLSSNIVVLPKYDEIGDLYADYVVVKQNGHYGLINLRDEEVVPCEYDKIDKDYHDLNHFEIDSQNDVFAVLKNKKWNYIHVKNECAINNRFDWISGQLPPCNYIIRQGSKYGMINQTGEIVVPAKYSNIYGDYGYYILSIDGRNGICDGEGKIIFPIENCKNIEIISAKAAIIEKDNKGELFFLDLSKTPIEYQTIDRFAGKYCKVSEKGKYGVINDDGNVIIPLIYDYISYDYRKKIIQVIKDGKFGIVDIDGNIIIPIKYDIIVSQEVTRYGDDDVIEKRMFYRGQENIPSLYGDAMIMRFDGNYGVLDSKGVEIIPFVYEMIEFFNGIFIAKKGRKVGALDINNKEIIPLQYDEIIPSGEINFSEEEDGALLLGRIKKNWVLLDMTGSKVSPITYDEIDRKGFAFMRLAVCRDGKWGFIDKKGREVIECKYDEVEQFIDKKHCQVKIDGTKMKIDSNGKVVD